MKNKLLTIVTCTMLASICTFGLTACGGESHTHAYKDVVTPATCTEQGFTTHTCDCGDVVVDTYVPALGHTWVDADCTTAKTCSVCQATDGEALNHSYTNYVYNNDAKCGVNGTETAICDREDCNESHTREKAGSALQHSFTNYIYNNDAKCGVDGTETAICDRDGCNEEDQRTKAGTALSHSFTNYVYNNDAKCGVDGTETAICDRDGCNEEDQRTKAGTALSHSFTTYVADGNATCLADGTKTAVCDNGCTETDTVADVGSKKDHKYTNYVPNGDATYAADGTKTAKCDYGCNVGEDTVADVGSRLKSTLTIVFGNGAQNIVINDYSGVNVATVEDPAKTGYTFTGWSAEIPATLPEGETTITANWSINQYTITIKLGNGDADIVITKDYNADIEAVEDPSRDNYVFEGWDAEIPAKMPANDLTINAKWSMDVSGDVYDSYSAYVSDEDDVLVIDELAYDGEFIVDAMLGETVLDSSAFSWNDNKLIFDQAIVDENIGAYVDLYVINGANQLIYIEVLFANKALKTATDVQMAFDVTAPYFIASTAANSTIGRGGNIEANLNTYVLANDVDMTGIVMYNRIKENVTGIVKYGDKNETFTTAKQLGFGGLFDGRGHVISNATVALNSAAVYGLESDMYNVAANGFFYAILKGGVIKNVAFVNIDDSTDGLASQGLSGVLGFTNYGATLENVFVDVSANTYTTRGVFSQISAGSTYTNVVVNFARPEGYTVESALAANSGNNHFAYNYGSLHGGVQGGSANPHEMTMTNVIIASPVPVMMIKGATGGIETVTRIFYGENETAHVYDFNGEFAGKTIQEVVAEYEENEVDVKNRKVAFQTGTNRYADLKAATDSDYIEALVATGFFRVVDGELTWHSVPVARTITEKVDFDALAGGVLDTAILDDEEIVSAKVGDKEVTFDGENFVGVPNLEAEENKIFTMVVTTKNYVYTFTNVEYKGREVIADNTAMDFDAAEGKLLTSKLEGITFTSARVGETEVTYKDGVFEGVPYMDNFISESQVFTLVLESSDAVYSFTNITYWTSIINTNTEFVKALDVDYDVTPINYGFYKLGNSLKVTNDDKIAFVYKGVNGTSLKDINSTLGFNGIFDGAGYTVDFNRTWVSSSAKTNGLFVNFNHDATNIPKQQITVKNLAILNVKGGGVPSFTLFAKHSKNHNYGNTILFENIYVYGMDDVPAGLIYIPGTGTEFRNILLYAVGNANFGNKYANVATYGSNIVENQTLTLSGYGGGLLFGSLRYGTSELANRVNSVVTLGTAPLVKHFDFGANYYMWFTNGDNGDGTYTHNLKVSGFNYGGAGAPEFIKNGSKEVYIGYASGNRTKGDIAMITGMKPGFAEIAKNYQAGAIQSSHTKLPGYYCATCGNVFSLEEGNCTTCVVDDAPVALTAAADLWMLECAYTWEARDLTTFTNGNNTMNQGEMKFDGAYKYDSVAEMKASNNDFASFVGEAGNGLWSVVEGQLTWVGAAA